MRFHQLWTFFFVSYWYAVALSAPFHNDGGGVKELMTAKDEIQGQEAFYVLLEVSPDQNVDYKEESSEHAKQKNDSTTAKPKKDYKTVCEDKTGKCDYSDMSLEELLRKIKELLKHDKMSSANIEELRSLFSKLEEKIHSECKSNSPKPVSQIEEHDKIERVFERKEHHDKSIGKEPHHQVVPHPTTHKQETSPPTVATTLDYLKYVTPEVNYNAGVPDTIDNLRQKYPQGLWPESGGQIDTKTYNSDRHDQPKPAIKPGVKKKTHEAHNKVGDNAGLLSLSMSGADEAVNDEDSNPFYYEDVDGK